VNLVMPASTWLGLADAPGEIAGTGAAGAGTCRDLAAALAARGDSRWCLTLTDATAAPWPTAARELDPARPAHRTPPSGSGKSRSPRSRPGPAPAAGNQPDTGPPPRYDT
jgi:hypothetical protein